MIIRRPADVLPSEITPPAIYQARREFMARSGRVALLGALTLGGTWVEASELPDLRPATPLPGDPPTRYKDITTYNNYYEFGVNKDEPAKTSGDLKTRPWTVVVEGLCNKPRSFGIEELLKLAPLEERVYRMRCVEGWSMVIPWAGYPLSALLRQVEPQAGAKFVEFTTLVDARVMPGIAYPVLHWPYVEGLRMDEAMHPLTLLTLGLYGKELLPQNGAPVRIVVPWKYGFKSAKSIVRIRLVDTMPLTAWNRAAPQEYGFYSNVNPAVDHPRWSQATERRIGEIAKRKTLLFNGYADQVAQLYTGMDLQKNF